MVIFAFFYGLFLHTCVRRECEL